MAADSIPEYAYARQVTIPSGSATPEEYNVVDPGFFKTLRLPIVAGRVFDAHDDAGSELGIVISASLANSLFAKANPVGRSVKLEIGDGVYATILGVVGDRKSAHSNRRGVTTVRKSEVYFSTTQAVARELRFVGRSNIAALPQKMSRSLQQADGDVAVVRAQSLFDYNRPIFEITVMGSIFGSIATVALILAMIGLFGIVAYSARQRTREIWIRIALGALPSRIARDVLEHAFRIVVAGLAIGFGLALSISQLMRTLFYGIKPLDPVAYAVVAVLFALVGLVAAWLPTRRAMRIDPMVALRPE
jgi:ABC-type antimicrobial peptide transport system permease subunit